MGVGQLPDAGDKVIEQRAEQARSQLFEFRLQDALGLALGQRFERKDDRAIHQVGAGDKVGDAFQHDRTRRPQQRLVDIL